MSNSAVITTKANFLNGTGMGVYLHWNGGRDSVEAFLKYCELKNYRHCDDGGYGFARLCQVIGNFFGGGLSVGIKVMDFTHDCGTDNGIYIIEGWEITDRKYFSGYEQSEYELDEMLNSIDECMPEGEQLGEDFFNAVETPVQDLVIGDVVFIKNPIDSKYTSHTVIGFGDSVVNGYDRTGQPYVNYIKPITNGRTYKDNPNNYVSGKMVRRVVR